ncbi:MAG: sulfite exporter TauE/SafE family protein [Phycisphaeraceae bacterium]|nr:sulfite exporter TauE/SafE family protein [Phycisphaeraceae bacterium]
MRGVVVLASGWAAGLSAGGVLGVIGLGAVAGVMGGLAGVGGSMVILPGLHAAMGSEPQSVHHLYMAAAMTVNAVYGLAAMLRHRAAGAVRGDLLPGLMGSALVAVVAGVAVSNGFDGNGLRYLLAVFIAGYCVWNTWQVVMGRAERVRAGRGPRAWRLVGTGLVMGFVSGLLGLGGGVLLVPMLQAVCGLRVREAVATSSAVVLGVSVLGAGAKLATLPAHGHSAVTALVLAGLMAPTAVIGARIGAGLTHSLPLGAVRVAITVLLAGAAGKLAGVW